MCAFNITDEWYNFRFFSDVLKEKSNPVTLGGHCVLCCGYNDAGVFIHNSWGYEDWGNYGFAVIPWSMFHRQFSYGMVVNDLKLDLNNIKEYLINES